MEQQDNIRAYLRWAWAQSTQRWGGRADVYIALVTYALVVIGIAAALIFGRWGDELDLAFKWAIGSLAVAGLLAFVIDFGIQTPKGLWIALKERIDNKIETITDLMTAGQKLRTDLGTEASFEKRQCEEWENRVYDWLAQNQPDFKEQFRLEFVPGGQQWSPKLKDKPIAADWLNTLDRRLYQLGQLLHYLRSQRRTVG